MPSDATANCDMKTMPASPRPAPADSAAASLAWRGPKIDKRSTGSAARRSAAMKTGMRMSVSSSGAHTFGETKLAPKFVDVELIDAERQRGQQHAQHRHADPVEGAAYRGPGRGQRRQGQDDDDHGDRQVDQEEPLPAEQSSRTPPRIGPIKKASPKTAPIRPSAPPRFSGREGVADHRAGDREDAACAQPLDGPADQEHREVRRERDDQ